MAFKESFHFLSPNALYFEGGATWKIDTSSTVVFLDNFCLFKMFDLFSKSLLPPSNVRNGFEIISPRRLKQFKFSEHLT